MYVTAFFLIQPEHGQIIPFVWRWFLVVLFPSLVSVEKAFKIKNHVLQTVLCLDAITLSNCNWNRIKLRDTEDSHPGCQGVFWGVPFNLCMFYFVHVWEVVCKSTLTKRCSCSVLQVQSMIQQHRTVWRLRWPPTAASLSAPGCGALSLLIPSVSLSSAVFCSSHE